MPIILDDDDNPIIQAPAGAPVVVDDEGNPIGSPATLRPESHKGTGVMDIDKVRQTLGTGAGEPDDELAPPPGPRPSPAPYEKVGSEPGIAGENVYESPRWAGAFATALLSGGTGILPLAARAALGGVGGKMVEQTIDTAKDRDSAPKDVGEALGQQALAGAETGLTELAGGIGGRVLGAAARRFFPPAAELRAGFSGRRGDEAVPAPSLMDKIVNKIRNNSGLTEAAQQLQKLDTPHPFEKLEPHESGGIVGAQEQQMFRLRKKHGNELYAPTDAVTGVKLSELLDENRQLMIPDGVEVPKEISKVLKRIHAAEKGVLKADGAAAAKQAKVRPGEIATNEADTAALDEAQLELDTALAELDNLPFGTLRKLRGALEKRLLATPERGPNASDRPALINAKKLLTLEMTEAAQKLDPELYAQWRAAEDFWGKEVAENHYRGTGRAIGKKELAGDPQKMSKVLEPFAPQDVTAAHKALVPGSWAPESARAAGQKAFDNLIEQRIATESGARNASDTVDLTKAAKVIDTRIGTAAWEEMKRLASPAQASRMESLEKIARAYQRIEPPPLAEAAMGPGAVMAAAQAANQMGVPGMVTGPIQAAAAAKLAYTYKLRPAVLRWALEHPARVELLTRDLDTAVGEKGTEIARRNLGTVLRLFAQDSGAPPASPWQRTAPWMTE